MDFFSALPHTRADALTYSPDGRWICCILSSPGKPDAKPSSSSRPSLAAAASTLQVRSSETLQVVRSWEVEVQLTSTEWSADGRYILAIAPAKEMGTACVFAMDASLEAEDGSDGAQGWVARIDTGLEGLVAGQWVPDAYTIVLFSQYDLHATFYSLPDLTIDVVQDVKLPRLLTCPQFPNLTALLRRRGGSESVILLRSLNQSEWVVEHSFPLNTVDAAGANWSPDGKYLAVWDYAAEFRLLVYTPLGYLRYSYMIAPDAVKPAVLPLAPSTAGNAPSATAPEKEKAPAKQVANTSSSADLTIVGPPTRAQRVVQAHRAKASGSTKPHTSKASSGGDPGCTLPKHAGGGLGVRQVAWSPTSQVLAVGGYDEKIHLLDPSTGAPIAVLDLSRTVLSHEHVHFRPRSGPVRFSHGRLEIWREPPLTWLHQRGDKIVSLVPTPRSAEGKLSPETVLAVRPENLPGAETSPRGGVVALEWNTSGTLLASRNESMPTSVFVHALNRELQGPPQPYLLAAILCGSTVKAVRWQPPLRGGGHAGQETLCIATGQGAIYTWTLRPDDGAASYTQLAEGIPVPEVRVDQATWAPSGAQCVLADASSFCVGVVP